MYGIWDIWEYSKNINSGKQKNLGTENFRKFYMIKIMFTKNFCNKKLWLIFMTVVMIVEKVFEAECFLTP